MWTLSCKLINFLSTLGYSEYLQSTCYQKVYFNERFEKLQVNLQFTIGECNIECLQKNGYKLWSLSIRLSMSTANDVNMFKEWYSRELNPYIKAFLEP